MSRDPSLRVLSQEAIRARTVPLDARCTRCGVSSPLTHTKDGWRCYAHIPGVADVELDHPAGRANMPRFVIPLDANWHRRITEFRRRNGMDEWPAANGEPLLMAAHTLAGLLSIGWLLAEWLVALAQWLSAAMGTDWFRRAPQFPIGN